MARVVDGGVPEPHRIDHRHSHAAVSRRSCFRRSSRSAECSRRRPQVSRSGSSRLFGALRSWLDERRRARQRKALLAKQAKKAESRARRRGRRRSPSSPLRSRAAAIDEDERPAEERRPPVMAKRPKTLENPPLPLPDPEPRQPRRNGAFTIPPLSLLDAPKTERKIDERELMEGARLLEEKCREFAVEGAVAQIHPGPVVTTFEFKPDAGVKYGKITEPRRRPVPRHAGRVGADRSHSRKIDRRHPDPESHARADFASRAAAVGDVSALGLEADARARQDDSRRAVHDRPRDDAAPADCGIDGHGQIGRDQLDAVEHPLPRDAGRGAAHHDRPEARRAGDVRRHPASDDARRRRSEAGRQRAALGREGDGGALQEAREGRRAQHRAVQPQRRASGEGQSGGGDGRAAACRSPTSSSSSTSWPI